MSEPQDTTQQTQAPVDWAAEAKKYGGSIAAPTSTAVAATTSSDSGQTDAADQAPIEKAPQGSAAKVADSINYGDSVKKYGGHITPAPQQSTLKKIVAGPGTAIGTEYKPFTEETSGMADILQGNIKKGASEIWAAEAPHVIPGSPLEKLIQKVNPNFKGEGGPAPEKPLSKPLVDAAQFVDGDKHPMGKAITETLQSFTSPESAAILASTGGLGMIESPAALGMANRLISRGFAVQSIAQAYANFKQFKEAYDSGDGARAEYFLTHMVLSGAMGAMAAQHAETQKSPAENAWTKAGAKADIALGKGVGAVVKAVKGVGERAADLIPDKKPEITPAEHLSQAADNLYAAIKPGKSLVADDFRATLDEAMPQLSVIANKNPNVSSPVEAAKAINEHIGGIEGQLKQKAFDMRGLPEARMDGIEEQVQKELDAAWTKAERKYTPDEIEKASASIMKMLGLETVRGENGMPEVNRIAPTPDLYGAENIRQRFADDTAPHYAAGRGDIPSAEIYAKKIASQVLREAIDAKFEEMGVPGVKEWRKQESALIPVRDALQEAAKRSEDAGKWNVWDAIFKRKGWGATPAIAGAVVGGLPGAVLGELAHVGADWWRDQQTNPNILTQKGWGPLIEAGPSEKAVIPGKKATIGQPELRGVPPEKEGFGDIENPNKGAAAVTPAPEYVQGGSKEGINEVRLKLGGEEKGGVYFTHEGDRASVNASWLDEAERGKGHGQNLLLEVAKRAKEQGAKVLTSDPKGETSRSAARVWEVLRDKGYPVEDIKMPNGARGYSLDLSKLGEKAKAATIGQPQLSATPENTKEFKDWFGKSKIVDAEGKPAVAYHGTTSPVDFEEFSTEGPPTDEEGNSLIASSGDPNAYMGAHFAIGDEARSTANKFAENKEGWMRSRYEGAEPKPRIIPVHLKLENPIEFKSERDLNAFINQGHITDEELLNEAAKADGIENPEDGGEEIDKWLEKYESDPEFRAEQNKWILNQRPSDLGYEEGSADAQNNAAAELGQEARANLKAKGHDGVVYKNDVEGGKSAIAFDSEQIRPAIANAEIAKKAFEQGQQYAPAWVVDERGSNIENLSEDEKAERGEETNQFGLKAPMTIPSTELPSGHTTQSVLHHEYGHLLEADRAGIQAVEIQSHSHPKNSGNAATAILDFKDFHADEKGRIDVAEIAPVFVEKFLPMFLGGGVVNSLIDGIPFEENTGLSGDLRSTKTGLRSLGFDSQQIGDIIKSTVEGMKNRLTGDPALDVIKKYAAEREPDLPDTHHASPARVQQFLNEVREARRGTKYEQEPSTGVGGGSEKPSGEVISQPELRGSGAGAEGNLREGNGEKVPSRLNLPMAARIAGTAALGALAGSRKKEEAPSQTPTETPGFAGYKTPEPAPERTTPLAGKTDIQGTIDSAAAEFGIPSTLLQAQARLESKLNPHAVSNKGAKGVMQLMDPTARALGVTDPYDPEQSIRGGAKLMSDLHKQFGHWDRALAAYNWKPDKVQEAIDKHGDRWLDHTPKETQNYVHIILGRE